MKTETEPKKKRIRTPAKKEHYVNNKEFLEAMIEYKIKCDKLKFSDGGYVAYANSKCLIIDNSCINR